MSTASDMALLAAALPPATVVYRQVQQHTGDFRDPICYKTCRLPLTRKSLSCSLMAYRHIRGKACAPQTAWLWMA